MVGAFKYWYLGSTYQNDGHKSSKEENVGRVEWMEMKAWGDV